LVYQIRKWWFLMSSTNENRPPVESVMFYALVNKDQISVDNLMRIIHQIQSDPKFEKLNFPFNRQDIIDCVLNWPIHVVLEWTNEGWTIQRKNNQRLPAGEPFFTESHFDEITKPKFQDEELMKEYKNKLMN